MGGGGLRARDLRLRPARHPRPATETAAGATRRLDAANAGETDKPAKTTTIAYRDLLSQIWILDPVPAWLPQGSELSRLKVAPKHQLADPALAARLLNHTPETLIQPRAGSAELLGQLFESLATLTVRAAAQAQESSVGHLRTGRAARRPAGRLGRADHGHRCLAPSRRHRRRPPGAAWLTRHTPQTPPLP